MSNLFQYYDYRKFLRDFYDEQKRLISVFSYRYMAKRLGIEHSTLIKILQGARHLTIKKVKNVIKLCGFSDKEGRYFENLVLFGRAKTERESAAYFEKLQKIQGVKQYNLENKQFEFFRHWYYAALWSLLNFYPFKGNFRELSSMLTPSVPVKKVKAAIEDMIDLSLIIIDSKGYYKTISQNISTGEKWQSVAVYEYLQSSLQLASEALSRFKKDKRDISALIVDIPEENLAEIKDLISEFRKSLIARINKYPKSDRVYQISMQVFPLTEKCEKK